MYSFNNKPGRKKNIIWNEFTDPCINYTTILFNTRNI